MADVDHWDPGQIDEVSEALVERARHSGTAAGELRGAHAIADWDGEAGEAAKEALEKSAVEHDSSAQNDVLAAMAAKMSAGDVRAVKNQQKSILEDAAADPAVSINLETNTITPPDTTDWEEDDVKKLADKMRDLINTTHDGVPYQVYGQLRNGTGELFDQAKGTSYTFKGGTLVSTNTPDPGKVTPDDELLFNAVTTAVGAPEAALVAKGLGQAGIHGLKTLLGREAFEGGAALTGDNVIPKALVAAEARADDAAANLAGHPPPVDRPTPAPVENPTPAPVGREQPLPSDSPEQPTPPTTGADDTPATTPDGPDHDQPIEPPLATTSDEAPFPAPQSISGMTEHGAQQVMTRDGHGVSDEALQRAVDKPTQPPKFTPDNYGGTCRYVGEDAIVVLNKDGQVVTAWATSRGGWRTP